MTNQGCFLLQGQLSTDAFYSLSKDQNVSLYQMRSNEINQDQRRSTNICCTRLHLVSVGFNLLHIVALGSPWLHLVALRYNWLNLVELCFTWLLFGITKCTMVYLVYFGVLLCMLVYFWFTKHLLTECSSAVTHKQFCQLCAPPPL